MTPTCQFGACIREALVHTPMGQLCGRCARRTLRFWVHVVAAQLAKEPHR